MARNFAITANFVAVLIVALASYVPNGRDCRHERASSVELPPEKVLLVIRDFHIQAFWTAYQKLDPVLKRLDRQSGTSGTVR